MIADYQLGQVVVVASLIPLQNKTRQLTPDLEEIGETRVEIPVVDPDFIALRVKKGEQEIMLVKTQLLKQAQKPNGPNPQNYLKKIIMP